MDLGQRPDVLHPKLDELLALEPKFVTNLALIASRFLEKQWRHLITQEMRDGTTHVLRCLKVWYDMPPEVFFIAVNYFDRFLSKMKAEPKHVACIAISSFQLAAELVAKDNPSCPPVPTAFNMAAISQCTCSTGELERMKGIISSKLAAQDGIKPILAHHFLSVFHEMFLAVDTGNIYSSVVNIDDMIQKLEIVTCDYALTNSRPSELALAFLIVQIDTGLHESFQTVPLDEVSPIKELALALKDYCKIHDWRIEYCHQYATATLKQYESQVQMPHRQRLLWKVSRRTLRYLRPTNKFQGKLPTINEHIMPQSESSSSEDMVMEGEEEQVCV